MRDIADKTIEVAIAALIERDDLGACFDSGILWYARLETVMSLKRIETIAFYVAASSEREARLKLAIEYPQYTIVSVSPQTDLVEAESETIETDPESKHDTMDHVILDREGEA